MATTVKQQIDTIDGTPKKRLFLSIISDYDLRTGLCELVDNALDLWMTNDRKYSLKIEVSLDAQRQLISVKDNAGGVKRSQLELLVAPGASRNSPEQELIGIFGVGGKRAGVALGEHVEIRTRAKGDKSLQLDITSSWLATEDWGLAAYEIPSIEQGTTTVEISKLRQSFGDDDVEQLRLHFGETYKWFIHQGCEIVLNRILIKPVSFDGWAYPPEFLPRTAEFTVSPADEKSLEVTITAGLIRDRNPEAENYGVYFYCNQRLILKELRTRDVGYHVRGEAGVPHPDASLCRVIVELRGPAEIMPWNSSKNGINHSHPAFMLIRGRIIDLTTYFSTLSRRLKYDWPKQVFAHPNGKAEVIGPEEIISSKKIALPKLPRARSLPRIEQLREANRTAISKQPWTLGLIEAMGLVDLITRQKKFDTRNRAALILLDSNFEIALKEFIVNRPDLFPSHIYNDAKIANIFKQRHQVIAEVQKHATLPVSLLNKVNYYYGLRNKLIHERATVGITDHQVSDYEGIIEKVLKILFSLKFPSIFD